MLEDKDWYPGRLEDRVAWHARLDERARDFAAKYGWDADLLAAIRADRLWIEHWHNEQVEHEATGRQLTKYIHVIGGNKTDADVPQKPKFNNSDDAPPEVPPGIEARTRALRRETVGRTYYSEADGLALGFEKLPADEPDRSQLAPELKIKTLDNYRLEVAFSKQGMGAVRFEVRRAGSWMPLGDKASSPAVLTVTPTTAGEAEKIELRAVFLKDYEPVGVYSPIYTALIAP